MSAGHVVVLNGGAGQSRARNAEDAIRAGFARHKLPVTVQIVGAGEDVTEAARRAVRTGASVIVGAGGDGTLNAVAGVVCGTSATLGILPLGTLNHFAKDAGIPLDIESAVDAVCLGRIKHVDVGRVNDHLFLNNSSLGVYARVVKERDTLTQRLGHGKWTSFVWASLTILRRHPFIDVTLETQGRSITCRTPLVFIGNNTYELDGLALGSRRRLDAGTLSIHVVARDDRMGLLSLAVSAVFGRLRKDKNFRTFAAASAEVLTHHRDIMVATDGEVRLMHSPLRYRSEARSLRILVPMEGA